MGQNSVSHIISQIHPRSPQRIECQDVRTDPFDRRRFAWLPFTLNDPETIVMAYFLLIDDDPALIPKQMRLAFPAPLHRVEVARTGAKGIKSIRADPPDVILLDLRLPDQSGVDV